MNVFLKLVIKKTEFFTYNDYVPKVMNEIVNDYNKVDVGGEKKANQDLEEAPLPKKAKRGRGRPKKVKSYGLYSKKGET
jgi:hypothetical protein